MTETTKNIRIALTASPKKRGSVEFTEFLAENLLFLLQNFDMEFTTGTKQAIENLTKSPDIESAATLDADFEKTDANNWGVRVRDALKNLQNENDTGSGMLGMITLAARTVEHNVYLVFHFPDDPLAADAKALRRIANAGLARLIDNMSLAGPMVKWLKDQVDGGRPLLSRANDAPRIMGTGTGRRCLGLLAHDSMKGKVVGYVLSRHDDIAQRFDRILATMRTGTDLLELLPPDSPLRERIALAAPGSHGGDVQIAREVANKGCHTTLFFSSPLQANPELHCDPELFAQNVIAQWSTSEEAYLLAKNPLEADAVLSTRARIPEEDIAYHVAQVRAYLSDLDEKGAAEVAKQIWEIETADDGSDRAALAQDSRALSATVKNQMISIALKKIADLLLGS